MPSVVWEGGDALKLNLEKAAELFLSEANHGLLNAGNAVMRVSKQQCPHDTGALMKTGIAEPNIGDNEVVLSYDTPYAVKMHEHTEYRFQKGRKAKYLEDPLKSGVTTMRNALILALKKIF